MRGFREELAAARAERDALIAELRYVVTHPLDVLGSIGSEYVEKWKRFEELSSQQTLPARFHAGRIFGEVLLDVLTVIGGGTAAVKAASKIPRLAKLARLKLPAKSARFGGGAAEAAATREARVTPSQIRPTPDAEGVAGEALLDTERVAAGGALRTKSGVVGGLGDGLASKALLQSSGSMRVLRCQRMRVPISPALKVHVRMS
jgi:hypothetical protein